MKAKLYIIPTPIAENANDTLPKRTLEQLNSVQTLIVERARTARRFLKSTNALYDISALKVIELDKHNEENNLKLIQSAFDGNENVGLLSEAGCPCIADPGAQVVRIARTIGYQIIPAIGPSSILLALMASGLNGQQFTFHGYLPIQKQERDSALKKLSANIQKTNYSQIFIETPYRNRQIFDAILKNVHPSLLLCIAKGISGQKESIRTMEISKWKAINMDWQKETCVFIIGN